MDAESIDTDADSASPETNYFKMMMQDNQSGRVNDGTDDSIIGGQTIASVMNNNVTKNGMNANANGSYSVSTAQTPTQNKNESMAIVGVDDDVSTLANDTVNETTKDFFTGQASQQNSKPRMRLFKEYSTPEKKKTNRKKGADGINNSDDDNDDDDDDETVPETPPDMIRVPDGNISTSSYRKDDRTINSYCGKRSFFGSRRVFVVAGVLALILFTSIVALSAALKNMRDSGSGTTDSSASTSASITEFEDGDSILDSWPDLDTGIIDNDKEPDTKPIFGEPDTTEDDTNNGQEFPVATTKPTFPSSSPTVSLATQFKFESIVALLVDSDAISSEKEIEKNQDTPQYYATTWLSRDPNYLDYSEDRVLQRWVLAVLAYSLDVSLSSTAVQQPLQRRLQSRRVQDNAGSDSDVLQGWLKYTDECTWFTSSTKGTPCDNNGMYTTIDIQNMPLGGTLPSELSLLAPSLEHIILQGNELVGSIPENFEDLFNLATLRLRRNNLEGSLSIDFGELLNLNILDLGKNKLTGNIPYSIVYMNLPTKIHLDYNQMTGEIPWEIGNLDSLTKLALSDNNLSGEIPDSVADLLNLKVLTLGNNKLSGDLPRDVCRFKDLAELSVDCATQGCECCTECASTSSPSSLPSKAQTGFPSTSPTVYPTSAFVRFTPQPVQTDNPTNKPSSSPTLFPTKKPTNPPTECVNEIEVFDLCFEPLVDIEVSLTNCNPDRDDWVGLYQMDNTFNANDLINPNIWSWACGTRNCREEASSNIIPFSSNHAGSNQWPLRPGTYVAIMARNSAQPYTAFAVSNTFVVAATC